MAFIHLHNHTRMSLLDGMIRVEDLVEHGAANGGAIAITDHGWLGGAAKFARMATEKGVKPLIGCEVYIVDDSTIKTSENREWWHLILIARTEEGYRNLCRLTTRSYAEGFYYKPRIDKKMLKEYSAGLICLSGCIGSEVPQKFCGGDPKAATAAAQWYQKLFGENYFIEVQDHDGTVEHEREDGSKIGEDEVNGFLVYVADKLGIGIVATNDAHYSKKDHGEIHDTMLAMQMGTWKGAKDRMRFPGAATGAFNFYLKSEKEMKALSKEKWWQSACVNTATVASLVKGNVITFSKPIIPQYTIPSDPGFEKWLKSR